MARTVIRAGFRLFVVSIRRMRLITFRLSGMEHFDPTLGQLIIANHPTLIDVVILIALFPQVDCVIKDAITRNPFLGMAVRVANYISNAESIDLLEACSARVSAGAQLILFPEGTRSVRGEPLRFKPGAAQVALQSQGSILPVVIDCCPQFLAKYEPWYHIPATTPHFDIRILPPVKTSELAGSNVPLRKARQALNERLQGLFQSELDRSGQSHFPD